MAIKKMKHIVLIYFINIPNPQWILKEN